MDLSKPVFAALALSGVAMIGLQASATPPVQSGLGPWVVLGTTKATHTTDHDTVYVKGSNRTFSQLKVGVSGASLHMQKFVVTYGNGLKDQIPVDYKIPKDSESRPIKLRGKVRVRQVDYSYDTKGWLNGAAKVTLYGR
jgi:hypothetical protein